MRLRTSLFAAVVTRLFDGCRVHGEMARVALAVQKCHSESRCGRTRLQSPSSESKSQFGQCFPADGPSDDEFRTYRRFLPDAGRTERRSEADRRAGNDGIGGRAARDDGIVMSLIRRCRSQSSSRRRRRRADGRDDDVIDDVTDDVAGEQIELSQLSGVTLSRRDLRDAGHKFATTYVDHDVPVWCDQCGQLIVLVYGHYAVCQCQSTARLSRPNFPFSSQGKGQTPSPSPPMSSSPFLSSSFLSCPLPSLPVSVYSTP